MEDKIKYEELYHLQDEVLKRVFSRPTFFYLTGGTCLHRFYFHLRYSDDLDFFCSEPDFFRVELRETLPLLESLALPVEVRIDTRDFLTLSVGNRLRLDFVNDRVYREGRSQKTDEGFYIDNTANILANKVTAILGRDEPKDVFDLVTLWKGTGVDWPATFKAAKKKMVFEHDALWDRLKSFPLSLLEDLHVVNRSSIEGMGTAIRSILDEWGSMAEGN